MKIKYKLKIKWVKHISGTFKKTFDLYLEVKYITHFETSNLLPEFFNKSLIETS